jgi:hypothetical protein
MDKDLWLASALQKQVKEEVKLLILENGLQFY